MFALAYLLCLALESISASSGEGHSEEIRRSTGNNDLLHNGSIYCQLVISSGVTVTK